MATSSRPGTLYFMTEEDLFGDPIGSYVKIGLVRDNDAGRSSVDRKREHQTGNPRALVLSHAIDTKASISSLEAGVHQALAMHRVTGEWFRLRSDGLDPFITCAESIRKELESQLETLEQVEMLSRQPDCGEESKPSSEASDIHAELIKTTSELQQLENLQLLIRMRLQTVGGETPVSIEGVCEHRISMSSPRFDSARFRKKYPEIVEEIGRSSLIPKFKHKKQPRREPNDALISLKQLLLAQQGQDSSEIQSINRDRISEQLHQEWLEFHSQILPLEMRQDRLKKNLMLLTGEHSGIEGLCSWTRKQEKKITASDLQEQYAQMVADFMVPGKINRSFVVNDFRPYRF
jgi:hypothetical protein